MATNHPPSNAPGQDSRPLGGDGGPGSYPESSYPLGQGAGSYQAPIGPPPGAAPSPRNNRPWLWVLGGLGGLGLLCCGGVLIFSLVLGGGIATIFAATSGPREATSGHFEAIEARDWAGAQGYLSSSLRRTTSAAALQARWEGRERTRGAAVDRFSARNTNITNNTATVAGTIHYKNGTTEERTVTLVKEGDDWKLSALP